MTTDKRSFELSKLDAATIYEALTLLSMMAAKPPRSMGLLERLARAQKPPAELPYSVASIDLLRGRVLDDAWPELKPTYEKEGSA